mmetsp:Transcript_26246/g.63252  ORF Transcript_26246/g.63252 Transcript_26246/m.63252 type:complete len:110 (-) Transcript_26246:186-515(-)|eukprot:CAMPEP_0114505238 /NCGR_PEP_ID=MMETSP0109-20121206/10741_1 /TAXON_ID=29199 /ORGANISM="Chlorarachnion reptans, Strain CCCM449" /LENGTH=109 /DNA_ID=CAMNT_0001683653 /DNA_START=69 /DNA_END=398 /DNA_ORIENTATION=-
MDLDEKNPAPEAGKDSKGNNVELYYPRKCSATNRLIGAKDHASVQINIGHVDEFGAYTGEYTTFALCGYIRHNSRGDSSLNKLASEAGLMKALSSFPHPSFGSQDGDDE